MLRIGNKAKGFTLVEIVIATAVLSLGSVLIYEAFFMCMDSFNYCSDYLNMAPWADEKIWEAQEELTFAGTLDELERTGDILRGNNKFSWFLYYNLVSTSVIKDLYEISLTLSWQQGKRVSKISRSAYIGYEKK